MDTIKIDDEGIYIPWDDVRPSLIVEVAEYLRDMNQPVPEGMAVEYHNLCGGDLDRVLNPSAYDQMHSAARQAGHGLEALASCDPELIQAATTDTADMLYRIVKAFALLAETFGEAEVAEKYLGPLHSAPNSALAAMLLQFPFGDVETERPNRQLALEAADVLGPDYAQLLYRFAVLVTKLA